MNRWVSMFIGLLLITSAVGGFIFFMNQYENNITTMTTVLPVRMLTPGELITEDLVEQMEIPTLRHIDGAITSLDEVIGKRAAMPIGETEEILPWKITDANLYPQKGEELHAFPIDSLGTVNNIIRKGDLVNVWVEYSVPKKVAYFPNGEKREVKDGELETIPAGTVVEDVSAEKILEKVRVYSVKASDGSEIVDNSSQVLDSLRSFTASKRDQNLFDRYRNAPSAAPSSITFILTDKEYQALANAKAKGVIKLGFNEPFLLIVDDKEAK